MLPLIGQQDEKQNTNLHNKNNKSFYQINVFRGRNKSQPYLLDDVFKTRILKYIYLLLTYFFHASYHSKLRYMLLIYLFLSSKEPIKIYLILMYHK